MNTLVETVDSVSAPPGPEAPFVAGGPLEEKHGRSQKYRNVAQDEKLTSTHWHIASANGLGWGFYGLDGALFAIRTTIVSQGSSGGLSGVPRGSTSPNLVGTAGTHG